MKKIIYITISFFICRLLGIADVWAGFALVSVLIFPGTAKNFIWEIPLGVLALSVATDAFASDLVSVLRITVLIAPLFTVYMYPKRLWLVFGVPIIAVVFKNIYTLSALWSLLWYSFRPVTFSLYKNYFSTKRQLLQGYNCETAEK